MLIKKSRVRCSEMGLPAHLVHPGAIFHPEKWGFVASSSTTLVKTCELAGKKKIKTVIGGKKNVVQINFSNTSSALRKTTSQKATSAGLRFFGILAPLKLVLY